VCGRFVASRSVEELVEEFAVEEVAARRELTPGPRFNISPQADVLAVSQRSSGRDGNRPSPAVRRLELFRWGLVPSWAKDPSIGARAFNARAETLRERPMFRAALERRRCIIPADAFYEWQKVPAALPEHPAFGAGPTSGTKGRAAKRPWCFRRPDGGPMGLAGLYEFWREETPTTRGAVTDATPLDAASGPERWLATCTIITTSANELMAPIHDRMPVILSGERYDQWLRPGAVSSAETTELLRPAPDDMLVAYEVSNEVGNSRSEGSFLIEPLAGS
jgi:putative SOS response-associated peptidase YedK